MKRPKRYTKNSAPTLSCHAEKHQKLAMEGQKFIQIWFCNKEKTPSTEMHDSPTEIDNFQPEPVCNKIISSQKNVPDPHKVSF